VKPFEVNIMKTDLVMNYQITPGERGMFILPCAMDGCRQTHNHV